ncbi:hypothetical protein FRC17_007172 [Serendipita sp. 399]|nr:hypothetical protein FRC17_007172 [Serendipita sp. 399]
MDSFANTASPCAINNVDKAATTALMIEVVPPSPTNDAITDGLSDFHWLDPEIRTHNEDMDDKVGRQRHHGQAQTMGWSQTVVPSLDLHDAIPFSSTTTTPCRTPDTLQPNPIKREGAIIQDTNGWISLPVTPPHLQQPARAYFKRKPPPKVYTCGECEGDAVEVTTTTTMLLSQKQMNRKPVPQYRQIQCTRCEVVAIVMEDVE